MLVQHPPMIHAASVVSHRHGQSTSEVFRKIYTNPELYNDNGAEEGGGGGAGGSGGAGGAGGNKTGRESYDFNNAMQMLGLDEASDTKDDPSSVQGAYLSFLSLRHLKIRDLQRTCISIFNYFRSIERMLTINDQGLSMNAKGGVERV
ncbi:unnamed protein product [Dibothriocephalus latus]|uniref:Uncharacterized protein n=1 Tax=Dibothriocephalus latus TaxID=60516 RepID=A0A3P7Q366_DIBLA|nr:unnamed protein product [Dibothriocephalus latus]